MNVRNYLLDDEEDKEVRLCKTLDDGKRCEEIRRVTKLDDGCIEESVEYLEEVVPMRTAQRTLRKYATIPVEEKIETIGRDGSIDTVVKSINERTLQLQANKSQEPTLNDVVLSLNSLANKIDNINHLQSNQHVAALAPANPLPPSPPAFAPQPAVAAAEPVSAIEAMKANDSESAIDPTDVKIDIQDSHFFRRAAAKYSDVTVSEDSTLTRTLTIIGWITLSAVSGWLAYTIF